MPRRAGTTRHILRAINGPDDDLDLKLLIGGLIERKGLEWTHDFFSRLQQRNRGSLRRVCARLGPLAVSTLLQAMTGADRWQDRIHSSELLMLFGGFKPKDQGKGDSGLLPQFHLHWDMSKLTIEELRQLKHLTAKAQPALAAAPGYGNGSGDD